MRISEMFGRDRPVVSFEFFPPKTEAGYRSLYRTIEELAPLSPGFVSVTWGAGGSTRRKTTELVIQIQTEIGVPSMSHMTCVGTSRADITATLDRLAAAGVENVLPLGGDRPEGYGPPDDGFEYANELVQFIRSGKEGSRWSFCLAGACYPETHPNSPTPEQDLAMTVQKVNAGVDFLITQLFFDNADYFDFVTRARAAGIRVPIVPGIMPVVSAANIRRISGLCGATIPPELSASLDACGEDPSRTLDVGIEWATAQCRELLEKGAPGVHFYTLNRSPATRQIYDAVMRD